MTSVMQFESVISENLFTPFLPLNTIVLIIDNKNTIVYG